MSSLIECFNQMATVHSDGNSFNLYMNQQVTSVQLNYVSRLLNFCTINILDLSSSSLKLQEIATIADFIATNAKIRNLNLWGNDIGDQGAKLLSNALLKNAYQSHIDLGSNGITNVGAGYLATVISQNKTLFSIELGSNQIKDAGALLLAEALATNTTLSEFHFADNPITEKAAVALVNALKKAGHTRMYRLRDDAEIQNLPELSARVLHDLYLTNYANSAIERVKTNEAALFLQLSRRIQLLAQIPYDIKCLILSTVNPFEAFDLNVVTNVLLSKLFIGKVPMELKFSGAELVRECFQLYRTNTIQ